MINQTFWQNTSLVCRWTNAPALPELTHSRDALYGQMIFTSGILLEDQIPAWDFHFKRLSESWKALLGESLASVNTLDLFLKQMLFSEQLAISAQTKELASPLRNFKLSLIPVSLNNAPFELPQFIELRLELRCRPMLPTDKIVQICQSMQRPWSPEIKTNSYWQAMEFYYEESQKASVNEILFIDQEGNLAEFTFSALIILKDNVFIFPRSNYNALKSISSKIMKIGLDRSKLKYEERSIKVKELDGALFWAINMVRGLEPVIELENKAQMVDSNWTTRLNKIFMEELSRSSKLKLELNYD
jgi:branched-subunit amino acid aminotransferase/4-amino-4-deoxychorismate lyase